MTATEVVAVPGEMIAPAAVAARTGIMAIVSRRPIGTVSLRAMSAIVVAVAAALLPRLAVMIARAVRPGNGGNQ